MPTKRQTYPVEFRGGLITSVSPLQQGVNMPGSATKLTNFEPSTVGGYRRILGFSKFDPNKIPPYGLAVVNGGSSVHSTNDTTLNISRTHTTPVVGDTFTIAGVAGTYRIDSIGSFSASNNTTTLTISRQDASGGLASSPANAAALTFLTYDTAYRTQGVEVFGDDVLVALNSDLYKTSGSGYTKINVPAYGTVLVNGGSNSGGNLAVDGLTVAPQAGDIFTIGSSGPTAKVNGAISSTTSLVVDNNLGTIVAGQTVTGTGISGTVTVASLSDQNNLVLSSAQSLDDNVDLTFSSTTDKVYTVTSAAGGTGGQTLAIAPNLASTPADNAAVTFISLNREGAGKTRFAEYNFAGTRKVAIVDGANPPALYDGTSFVELTGAPSDALAATHVTTFKKHIFYGKNDVVTFTGPLLDSDFTSGNGGGSFRVGGDVTGLIPFRESLIIFTDKTIQQISGTSLANFALAPISEDIGCIDGDSIQEVGGDIMFLTADGLRLLSATDRNNDFGLGIISKSIQSTLGNFITTGTFFTGLVVRSKSQYRLFSYVAGQRDDAAKGIIATQFSPQGGADFQYAELRGIRVFSANSKMIGANEKIVFSSDNGFLYKMEDGNSFDGSNIKADYISPFLPINDPRVRKTIYKANLFTDPQGAVNFKFNLKFDFDELNSVQPAAIDFTNTVAAISFYGVQRFSKYATTTSSSGSTGDTSIVVSSTTNMVKGDTIVARNGSIPDNTLIGDISSTTINLVDADGTAVALTADIGSGVRITDAGATFGGKVQNLFTTQTVGTGFTTAIQFGSDSQDPPFSLDTVTLEYGTNTRR